MIRFPEAFADEKDCDNEDTALPSALADWIRVIGDEEKLPWAIRGAEKPAVDANTIVQNAKAYLHPIVQFSRCLDFRGWFWQMHLICQSFSAQRMNRLGKQPAFLRCLWWEKIPIMRTFVLIMGLTQKYEWGAPCSSALSSSPKLLYSGERMNFTSSFDSYCSSNLRNKRLRARSRGQR